MDKVADDKFLVKRGNVWIYYRRVPTHLVPVLGLTHFKKSLRTADLKEARKLRNLESVRIDALISLHENEQNVVSAVSSFSSSSKTAIPFSVLSEHVRSTFASLDRKALDRLAANPPKDKEELKYMRMDAEIELGILRNPDDPRRHEIVDRLGDRILDEIGADISDQQSSNSFAEIVRRALMEVVHRKMDRYEDNHGQVFHDAFFDPDRQSEHTFGELVDIFKKEKLEKYKADDVRLMSVDKLEVVCELFREIVGSETKVRDINDDIVQQVRRTIAQIPVNRTKHYPQLSIQQAIKRAEKEGRARLAPLTQKGHLTTFKEMFSTALRKRMITYNPTDGLQPLKKDKVPLDEKRLPFRLEQIKAFFEGHFYKSCVFSNETTYSKRDKEWRFWFPLIMLFSSARPNEIAQLLVDDCKRTKAGTWYFDFADLVDDEDGNHKSLKTSTSRRKPPIHSELIRLGFLDFVEKRKKQKAKNGPRLFHELKPNKYGNLAYYVNRRFREVFLPSEIQVDDRQTFYSIRHSVRDALRRAQVPSEALLVIGGWSQGNAPVSSDYGDPRDPDISRMWVEKITYPGLDLSFLYPDGS